MARWHAASCESPRIWVGEDSIPRCKACGNSAHQLLQEQTENPSDPFSPLSPNEMPGQLNLSWPSSVPYIRTKPEKGGGLSMAENQARTLAGEFCDSPQLSNERPSSRGERVLEKYQSLIHGGTLAADEFRLVYLTAEGAPADTIHVSLETYKDGNFPGYEAASYTWGGEDGDGTL